MTGDPVCPRCGRLVYSQAPQGSTCPVHGVVTPLKPFRQPNSDLLGFIAAHSRVPIWLPWPLPRGWVVTGVGHAGSDREGVRGTVLACSGPDPVGDGGGELMIVAEELGVGLGARYAGLDGPDPGGAIGSGSPQGRVETSGHPTSLWHVPSPPDRAVYAGSAAGLWIWLVFFPASVGVLLLEPVSLADARALGQEVDMLPFGSLTPRLDYPEPS